ncbi:unnamed protein product [Adineta steineri]|uniref:F-box domain-containing protein n=1 Tax=Adineta steineri TaxID=433720 RepID=A0A819V6Y1_9BILA|nr:unnamed protein product [Adineta steineri]CAF4104480.1 unnamed protein product [Adineta steineri]CAF4135964.1 unnamed protein product [Adineta steineri]
MNSPRITRLEDLPVEMLMEIFIYFTADQIYFSFSQLNNYFNLILKSLPKLILVIHEHLDPFVLSFFNSFNKILVKFCDSHINRYRCRCQSHSINGGNRLYEIYPMIDPGWYLEFNENLFSYDPSKIDNIIHPDNYSRLQSLVLPHASSKLTQLIFNGEFPRLKVCHLGKCEPIILSFPMTIQLQDLRQLTIRGQQGHVLEKILLVCPCLVYLDFSCNDSIPPFHFINRCFPSMEYLRLGRLKHFFFHNGQFVFLLSLFPNLLQFHLIVNDVDTINIQEIANYLHRQCPLLKILVLRIYMQAHMCRFSSVGNFKEITKMHSLFKYIEKCKSRLTITSHGFIPHSVYTYRYTRRSCR